MKVTCRGDDMYIKGAHAENIWDAQVRQGNKNIHYLKKINKLEKFSNKENKVKRKVQLHLCKCFTRNARRRKKLNITPMPQFEQRYSN